MAEGLIYGFLMLALIGGGYFLPTIIAFQKKKKNATAVFALNLLLGWTMLGWIIAIVWALTND